MLELLVILVVAAAVVALVGAPLRRAGSERDADAAARAELADLEASKEAKYREIRDAELDHRTGKLTDEDFAAVDAELRADAVTLLKRIDAVRAGLAEEPARAGADA